MKIENYDDLKFTSLKNGIDVINFKYKGVDYVLNNGGTEMTLTMTLYKKTTKNKLEYIKGYYGVDFGIIKYKNNKINLKSIDKEHFVLSLIKRKILQGTKEQLIRIKEIERDDLEKNLNLIKQKINKINEEILKIELEEEESSEKDNSI